MALSLEELTYGKSVEAVAAAIDLTPAEQESQILQT